MANGGKYKNNYNQQNSSIVRTLLKLGRVSNLPTVWSNVVMAALVGGHELSSGYFSLLLALFAGSLAYIGGMFLNDAFDADYDRVHQQFRPIPSGDISRQLVFVIGSALLAFSVSGFLYSGGFQRSESFIYTYDLSVPFYGLSRTALLSLGLVASIVGYNWVHKFWGLAFALMASSRFLLVLLAADSVMGSLSSFVLLSAGLVFFYTCLLTIIARNEDRLPVFKGKIAQLIAGFCLLDLAIVLALAEAKLWGGIFPALFLLTIRLQRWVRGT